MRSTSLAGVSPLFTINDETLDDGATERTKRQQAHTGTFEKRLTGDLVLSLA